MLQGPAGAATPAAGPMDDATSAGPSSHGRPALRCQHGGRLCRTRGAHAWPAWPAWHAQCRRPGWGHWCVQSFPDCSCTCWSALVPAADGPAEPWPAHERGHPAHRLVPPVAECWPRAAVGSDLHSSPGRLQEPANAGVHDDGPHTAAAAAAAAAGPSSEDPYASCVDEPSPGAADKPCGQPNSCTAGGHPHCSRRHASQSEVPEFSSVLRAAPVCVPGEGAPAVRASSVHAGERPACDTTARSAVTHAVSCGCLPGSSWPLRRQRQRFCWSFFGRGCREQFVEPADDGVPLVGYKPGEHDQEFCVVHG